MAGFSPHCWGFSSDWQWRPQLGAWLCCDLAVGSFPWRTAARQWLEAMLGRWSSGVTAGSKLGYSILLLQSIASWCSRTCRFSCSASRIRWIIFWFGGGEGFALEAENSPVCMRMYPSLCYIGLETPCSLYISVQMIVIDAEIPLHPDAELSSAFWSGVSERVLSWSLSSSYCGYTRDLCSVHLS